MTGITCTRCPTLSAPGSASAPPRPDAATVARGVPPPCVHSPDGGKRRRTASLRFGERSCRARVGALAPGRARPVSLAGAGAGLVELQEAGDWAVAHHAGALRTAPARSTRRRRQAPLSGRRVGAARITAGLHQGATRAPCLRPGVLPPITATLIAGGQGGGITGRRRCAQGAGFRRFPGRGSVTGPAAGGRVEGAPSGSPRLGHRRGRYQVCIRVAWVRAWITACGAAQLLGNGLHAGLDGGAGR